MNNAIFWLFFYCMIKKTLVCVLLLGRQAKGWGCGRLARTPSRHWLRIQINWKK